MRNRVVEIRKLTSPSDWHHYPSTDNLADLVSKGVKVSKLIDEPSWLLEPKWLSFPPELWPPYEDKGIIGKNELEYRKET